MLSILILLPPFSFQLFYQTLSIRNKISGDYCLLQHDALFSLLPPKTKAAHCSETIVNFSRLYDVTSQKAAIFTHDREKVTSFSLTMYVLSLM